MNRKKGQVHSLNCRVVNEVVAFCTWRGNSVSSSFPLPPSTFSLNPCKHEQQTAQQSYFWKYHFKLHSRMVPLSKMTQNKSKWNSVHIETEYIRKAQLSFHLTFLCRDTLAGVPYGKKGLWLSDRVPALHEKDLRFNPSHFWEHICWEHSRWLEKLVTWDPRDFLPVMAVRTDLDIPMNGLAHSFKSLNSMAAVLPFSVIAVMVTWYSFCVLCTDPTFSSLLAS